MADGSKIEWTDATSGRAEEVKHSAVRGQAGRHQVERFEGQPVDPWPRVSVTLCAVTRLAGRNYVARDAESTGFDGDHVVERGGDLSAAVGTEAARGLEQHRSGLVSHDGHSASTCGGAPLCRPPIGAVAGAVPFIRVRPAEPSGHILDWEPRAASATPGNAAPCRRLTFRLGRSRRQSGAMKAAGGAQAVASGPISTESFPWLPRLAPRAPLLGLETHHVVVQCQAEARRSCSLRTDLGSHTASISGGSHG